MSPGTAETLPGSAPLKEGTASLRSFTGGDAGGRHHPGRGPRLPGDPVRSHLQRCRVILSDAAKGLYSQMYYWGMDVKHPAGNLLVAYGMSRMARETAKGTSRYRLPWHGGLIELHGFCAGWYGPEGGIVFCRSSNVWLAWPQPQPPDPGRLDEACGLCARNADTVEKLERAALLVQWVHGYESWARRQWGAGGRDEHHQAYLKLRPRRWWLPPDLSLQWFSQFAARPAQVARPKTLQATR